MIEIVLFILKIIGIILLSLLSIILVLVGLALFVPIRYCIQAEKGGSFWAQGKISWLLKIISISFRYEKEMLVKLRFFGIPIYDNKKPKKEKKQKQKKETPQNEKTDETDKETTPKILNTEQKEDKKVESCEDTVKKPDEMSFWEKCKLFFRKIMTWLQNLKYTFKHFCDKIKQILENIQYFIEVMERDETKKAFSLCKKSILKLLKWIKPKKFKMYLHIGTNDPALTGQILVYYSMLYPFVGKNIVIEPDFEVFVLEGNVYAKGSMQLIVLICVAWKLFFDKNIRKVIALFRKEEE